MLVKFLKWIIRLVFTYLIWRERGPLSAVIYFIICIPIDFIALTYADGLAIRYLRKFDKERWPDRQKAAKELINYRTVPGWQAPPFIGFTQIILSTLFSLSIPILIGGLFLKWFF